MAELVIPVGETIGPGGIDWDTWDCYAGFTVEDIKMRLEWAAYQGQTHTAQWMVHRPLFVGGTGFERSEQIHADADRLDRDEQNLIDIEALTIPTDDADYEAEDGCVITVVGGVVEALTEAETEAEMAQLTSNAAILRRLEALEAKDAQSQNTMAASASSWRNSTARCLPPRAPWPMLRPARRSTPRPSRSSMAKPSTITACKPSRLPSSTRSLHLPFCHAFFRILRPTGV
jgi:hypothetical protein